MNSRQYRCELFESTFSFEIISHYPCYLCFHFLCSFRDVGELIADHRNFNVRFFLLFVSRMSQIGRPRCQRSRKNGPFFPFSHSIPKSIFAITTLAALVSHAPNGFFDLRSGICSRLFANCLATRALICSHLIASFTAIIPK